jgi:flagellar protein FliS
MDARLSYREAAVRGASQTGLVVLLYEQLLEDLHRAVQAIEQNKIELRTKEINHAVSVTGYLQDGLDMARGGEAARNLERFYVHLRGRLLEAQAQASKEILAQQITDLLELREAWAAVDRAQQPHTAPPASATQLPRPELRMSGEGWKA